MLQLILFSLTVVSYLPYSRGWGYTDQESWPERFCSKSIAQSPIDIAPRSAIKLRMRPLLGSNWYNRHNATISNNGHTVTVEPSSDERITISGGGLPGKYILNQFHFHWLSEHTIDSQRKALEIHFVTYNNKFNSSEEALEYTNGIGVFAVLCDFSEEDNHRLKPIIDELGNLQNSKSSRRINLKLSDLLPRDRTRFYRYYGSLTTPDCNDNVVWTIFEDTCKVSKAQVDKFTRIKDAQGARVINNFRKTQPLNCRNVYCVYAEDDN